MEEALKYQSVFSANNAKHSTRRIKKRRSVSRLGCRRCKIRKVKCDENKPRCHNCIRNNLECSWPFPLNTESDMSPSKEKLTISTLTEGKSVDKNNHSTIYITPDSATNNDSPMLFPYKQYDSWIPGVRLSRKDAFCYYAFVKKFLRNIAHCYIGENNPIVSVFPQLANSSSLIREIYYTCGSYTLGSVNSDFKEISQVKYNNVLSLFNEQFENELHFSSEQWLIAQLLHLLCLKHKFGGSSGSYETMTHFCTSLKVLSEFKDSYNYLTLDELFFYMNGLNDQPYVNGIGEVMVDSLIFNYPVINLFCEYQYLGTLVPNPFDRSFLYEIALNNSKQQGDPHDNPDIFKYNISSLQIAAKATWLFRTIFLNDKVDILVVNELINLSYERLGYLKRLLTNELNLKSCQNILVANLIYTSSIILFKAIICRVNFLEMELGSDMNYMIEILEDCCLKDIILPVWCLAVGALASSTSDKKDFFKNQLLKMKYEMNIVSIENLIRYLESIWEISESGMALSKLLQLPTFNPLYI